MNDGLVGRREIFSFFGVKLLLHAHLCAPFRFEHESHRGWFWDGPVRPTRRLSLEVFSLGYFDGESWAGRRKWRLWCESISLFSNNANIRNRARKSAAISGIRGGKKEKGGGRSKTDCSF